MEITKLLMDFFNSILDKLSGENIIYTPSGVFPLGDKKLQIVRENKVLKINFNGIFLPHGPVLLVYENKKYILSYLFNTYETYEYFRIEREL